MQRLINKLIKLICLCLICVNAHALNKISDEQLKDKLRMLFLVADNFVDYTNQYGGYIFYQSHIKRNICDIKKPGSLYLVDHEGGRVNRISSNLPSANKALETPNYNEQWSRDAKALKSMCFDVILGPTVDKELGDRSYSHSLQTNIQKSDEVRHIINQNHLISVYKHFPGRYNSCKQKDLTKEIEYCNELQHEIMKDWIAFNNNDTQAIMISNYVYTGVSLKPAVLEPQYYTMLRHDLNYKGVIITDALWEMSVSLNNERIWSVFKNADLIMIMNANEVEKFIPFLMQKIRENGTSLIDNKLAKIKKMQAFNNP